MTEGYEVSNRYGVVLKDLSIVETCAVERGGFGSNLRGFGSGSRIIVYSVKAMQWRANAVQHLVSGSL